jgi:hypothetical protein
MIRGASGSGARAAARGLPPRDDERDAPLLFRLDDPPPDRDDWPPADLFDCPPPDRED